MDCESRCCTIEGEFMDEACSNWPRPEGVRVGGAVGAEPVAPAGRAVQLSQVGQRRGAQERRRVEALGGGRVRRRFFLDGGGGGAATDGSVGRRHVSLVFLVGRQQVGDAEVLLMLSQDSEF